MIEFLNQDRLIGIFIATGLVISLFIWVYFWRLISLRRFFQVGKNPFKMVESLSIKKSYIRLFCLLMLWICICVAYLRPYKGFDTFQKPEINHDLLIILDISRSMDTKDVKYGSRLDYAKWWLKELVFQLPSNRIGLVTFSGISYLEYPLTIDRSNLFFILQSLDTSHLPFGGTNIEKALDEAYTVLTKREGSDQRLKSILLISDGGQLQGNYQKVLKKLNKANIKVHIFGVGNKNKKTPILDKDNRYIRDKLGNIIQSQLEASILKDITQKTKSIYVEYDAKNLLKTGHQKLLKSFNKSTKKNSQKQTIKKPKEIYQYFLIPALIFAFIYFLIGERKHMLSIFLSLSILSASLSNQAYGQIIEENKIIELDESLTNKQQYNQIMQNFKKIPKESLEALEKLLKVAKDLQVKSAIEYNFGTLKYQQAKKILDQGFEKTPKQAEKLLFDAEEHYKKSNKLFKSSKKIVPTLRSVIKKGKQAEEFIKKKKSLDFVLKQAIENTKESLDTQREFFTHKIVFFNVWNKINQAEKKVKELVHLAQQLNSKKIAQFSKALNLLTEAKKIIRLAKEGNINRAEQKTAEAYKILNSFQDKKNQDKKNQDKKNQDKKNQDKKNQDKKNQDKKNQDKKNQDKKNQDKKGQDKKNQDKKNQDKKGQDKKNQDKKNQDKKNQDKKNQDKKNQDKKGQDKKNQDKKGQDKKNQDKKNQDTKGQDKKKRRIAESEIKAILQKSALNEENLRQLFLRQRSHKKRKKGDLDW